MPEIIDTVSTALVENNLTEQKLIQLEKDYKGLALKPITNDEELEVAMVAKRDLRTTRTTAVKICKAGREDAIAIQKVWLDKEKSIVARVEAIENPLDEQVEAYKEIAAKRQREEEAEKKLSFREKIIQNASIVAEPSVYKYLTDEEFQAFFDAQCLAIQEAKLAKEKAEAEEKEREAMKKKAAEDALANAQKDIRKSKMEAMGFRYSLQSGYFVFEIINVHLIKVHMSDIEDINIAEFQWLCDTWSTEIFEARKKETAKNLEAITNKAIADANAEMEKKNAEQKRIADAEALAKKNAEEAEQKRLEAIRIADIKKKALAPDKEKLQEFVNNIKPDYPIVSSDQGKAVVARAKQLFTITINDLQKYINAL